MVESRILMDGDLVRLSNKTLGLCLSSPPKKLDFYRNTARLVTYYDPTHKYEKIMSVPIIEENKNELKLILSVTPTTSQLSAFKILRLSSHCNDFSLNAKSNMRNKIIESYLDNMPKQGNQAICKGEPVLIKSEANNLYLGVKRHTKQMVYLSCLENAACEFIFVLETSGASENITYEDSFQIKSLLGGSITINSTSESISLEDLVSETDSEKIGDLRQLLIEETIDRTEVKETHLRHLEAVNSFIPANYSLRFFSIDSLEQHEIQQVESLAQTLREVIDYQIFLQEWGTILGKALKDAHYEDRAETNYFIHDETFYYDFEEASETQDKLINNTDTIVESLDTLKHNLLNRNIIEFLDWQRKALHPDLALKMRQNAMIDLALLDYLVLIIRSILVKTYMSIDFDKIFGIKHDVDRKRDSDTHARKIKMKRLLLDKSIDWRKIRQTPQGVCRLALDKLLKVCLEIIYIAIKSNPQSVRAIAGYTDLFYYSTSLQSESAINILTEIAKYMNYANDSHVCFYH